MSWEVFRIDPLDLSQKFSVIGDVESLENVKLKLLKNISLVSCGVFKANAI